MLALFRFMVMRFIGPTTVKVEKGNSNNSNNKDTILNGKHILIATGSKPMNLNIPGEENIVTSDQFLGQDVKTYLIQLYLSVEDISHLSLHILQHVLEQMLLFCIVANNLLSTSITILLIDW